MRYEKALNLAEEFGRMSKTNEPIISVYGGEGNLPHLHFKNERVESCIRLNAPKYFCHEAYQDGLNSAERKWFFNWIKV